MNLPATSGQPLLSPGQHRIAAFMMAAMALARACELCGNQTDAEMVLDAQKQFDATLGELTKYVLNHEMIAAAYAADSHGGPRSLSGMTHDTAAGEVREGTNCPQ